MKQGLRFYMQNGEIDCYDPVDVNDLQIVGYEYNFYVGGYNYVLRKEDVLRIEFYLVCDECGKEVEQGEKCYSYKCLQLRYPCEYR